MATTKTRTAVSKSKSSKATAKSTSKASTKPGAKGSTKSRSNQARKRKAAASAPAQKLQQAIIETSSTSWSQSSVGPTFEQVQLAAYHRWLQHGGSEFDNWTQAENDLRGH